MSEMTPEASASTLADPDPAPAAAAPDEPAPTPARRSLEDLLGSLDEDSRSVVLGEVSKARNEAKGLRDRLREAEPKLTEWQRLQEASQTDLERAQEAARKAQESTASLRDRVVAAEIRAALTGIVPDPSTVIEDLNLARFAGEDGEVNAEAIEALRSKYAAFAPLGARPPAPNPAQGSSGSGPASVAQLTEADLQQMTPAQIVEAQNEGRLASLGYGVKKS